MDEMHVAIAPLLLGAGEHLWSEVNVPALGYRVAERMPSEGALHVAVRKG